MASADLIFWLMKNFPSALLEGYREFRDVRLAGERERYRVLAERGQKPETLIVACCDSRAAPETIFNASPGELFVVRTVANMVPRYEPDSRNLAASAALEFAVQGLRVKHIVVLGHGRCGGIAAALDPAPAPLSPGDFIGKWMAPLTPAAQTIAADDGLTAAERQLALERQSIANSIENLRTFPFISDLVGQGRLSLHGAWFDIANGDLMVMDPETGRFVDTAVAPS